MGRNTFPGKSMMPKNLPAENPGSIPFCPFFVPIIHETVRFVKEALIKREKPIPAGNKNAGFLKTLRRIDCYRSTLVISLGTTHLSYSSSVTKPRARAASRRELLSAKAFLAICADFS